MSPQSKTLGGVEEKFTRRDDAIARFGIVVNFALPRLNNSGYIERQ
jgi:hypothetical protein